MSEEAKQLVLGKDYKTWKRTDAGEAFLLVVYSDDDGSSTKLMIDIPLAMQEDGLTQRVWEWLSVNAHSDVESEGPGPKWLEGIREDTDSKAWHVLESPILSSRVVVMHVHTTWV